MKKHIIHSTFIMLLVFVQLLAKAQNIRDGITLSHAGKYDEAEKVFRRLIGENPEQTAVLIASGFNNAWNKNYRVAKNRFQQALLIEPSSEEAAKGLAYTYLYNGEYHKAAEAFSTLSMAHFTTEEYHFALGLAYMNLQKKNKAYLQFEKVWNLNQSNAEAEKFLKDIRAGKGILELSAMGGITSTEGESKFGLRQVMAGFHVNNETFVYARYDNSLAQDNYFFIKNNYNSNALIAGVYARWHYRAGSKFEYGYRSLPGKSAQHIFQTEQVIFLPKNFAIKMGGAVINNSQSQNIIQSPNEWMLMGSVSVPAGKKIKIEPHYYFIHRTDDEHRLLLNLSYQFSAKTDLAIGVYNGSEKNIKTSVNNKMFGLYGYSNFLITGPLSGTILTRYEKDAFDRSSFIAALGLKVTLDTKRN